MDMWPERKLFLKCLPNHAKIHMSMFPFCRLSFTYVNKPSVILNIRSQFITFLIKLIILLLCFMVRGNWLKILGIDKQERASEPSFINCRPFYKTLNMAFISVTLLHCINSTSFIQCSQNFENKKMPKKQYICPNRKWKRWWESIADKNNSDNFWVKIKGSIVVLHPNVLCCNINGNEFKHSIVNWINYNHKYSYEN